MYVIAIPWFWGYEKVMAGMPTVVAVEVVFALTEDFFWCDQAADIRHTYSPWGSVMQYPPRLKQLEEPVPHLMGSHCRISDRVGPLDTAKAARLRPAFDRRAQARPSASIFPGRSIRSHRRYLTDEFEKRLSRNAL